MEMKNKEYLKYLGSHFEQIRKLFGWRQEDAAVRMGISRSKVVAIETEPTKLTESEATSLFFACDYEVYKAKLSLKKLNKENFKNRASSILSSTAFISSPLFLSAVVGVVAVAKPSLVAKMVPTIGSVFGSIWATASAKKKKENQINELTKKEVLDYESLKAGMEQTIKEMEKELLKIFALENWDRFEFYEKVHPDLILEEE